jgi:hypothetical protein
MPTRRRERNQQLFRGVNERIRDLSVGFERLTAEGIDFLCECADQSCTDRITLTLAEYERIPRTGDYFLVKAVHEQSEFKAPDVHFRALPCKLDLI